MAVLAIIGDVGLFFLCANAFVEKYCSGTGAVCMTRMNLGPESARLSKTTGLESIWLYYLHKYTVKADSVVQPWNVEVRE